MSAGFGLVAVLVLLAICAVAWHRRRRPRRRVSVGPGAAGAFYELLDRDRRAAIEIIVEERAGYRDPEDRDGNLPELAQSPAADRKARR
jgi:hypothetical protein